MTGRVIPFPSRAPEPPEPDNERGFEELTRVGDQAEALVVRGLLEAHGIEVLLRSQVAPSVYPFSVGEQGAVQVLVRREALADEPPPPRPGHPGPVLSLATAGPRRQHSVLGALGLLAGTVRWLSLRGIFPERPAGILWPLLVTALGLFLTFCYREIT